MLILISIRQFDEKAAVLRDDLAKEGKIRSENEGALRRYLEIDIPKLYDSLRAWNHARVHFPGPASEEPAAAGQLASWGERAYPGSSSLAPTLSPTGYMCRCSA